MSVNAVPTSYPNGRSTPYERIPLEVFDKIHLPYLNEVSSEALGARVLSCSDDFFASKDNLIKRAPSRSLKGQFGPGGASYDGWESRRHNPTFDWVIIRLGPDSSHLTYFDIDTSHFSGNEAPEAQVFALTLSDTEVASKFSLKLSPNEKRWQEVLPVVELDPNSRHIFECSPRAREGAVGAVMVRMIPDGGMARFRAYGEPIPPKLTNALQESNSEPINLLSALTGARVVSCSDAHFSPPGNLLLPGRGHDMSDGFETRRSQEGRGKYAKDGRLAGQERREWVVVKMSCTGMVKWVEVDTAFHPGNYPVACKIEAALSDDVPNEAQWATIVDKKPLGPHRQHWFDIERDVKPQTVYSHIRLTIYPDGGLKRLRVYGHPLNPAAEASTTLSGRLTIPALPLTPEAFVPYGQVIQGFTFASSAPKGIYTTTANQGTATKFHRMARIEYTYSNDDLPKGGPYIACTHAEKQADTKQGLRHSIKILERNNHTTQAVIPMGRGTFNEEPLGAGGAHLIVVALAGNDGEPDLGTLRAFLATAAQGVSYNVGTWRQPLRTLDGPLNYAVVEARTADGSGLARESRIQHSSYGDVIIPPYTPVTSFPSSPTEERRLVERTSETAATLDAVGRAALTPEPISAEAFAPYGQIIRTSPNPATVSSELSAERDPRNDYGQLTDIIQSYPAGEGAQTAISVYRGTPKVGLERGKDFPVKLLERHSFTTQAFVPMGKGEWPDKSEAALPAGGEMLVIVARNGLGDGPDPSTLKAFRCPSSIGISYHQGVWHHPVLVLDQTMDLACIETQLSIGDSQPDSRDCEVIETDVPWGIVAVPM